MKPTFACVLKLGGDYLPEHVRALATQVRRHTTIPHNFVCYTDYSGSIDGVTSIPLLSGYPGWWSVPEVYRQKGPTVITGIDTVIRGNIDGLFRIAMDSRPSDFWMIRAFADPKKTASGIMIYNGDWSWLWDEYQYPQVKSQFIGEQDYTNAMFKSRGIVPKIVQNKFSGIYSWKKHCRRNIPANCRIILFHGKPRPFEVPKIWEQIVGSDYGKVEERWPDSTVYILGGGPSLNKVNFDLIKDKHVLGVNQAYQLGDWVDVCYSGDRRWYYWNVPQVSKYKGIMYTSYPAFLPRKNCPTINLGRISSYGISDKSRHSIAWNGNSGASAINVAYWLGARRVVLLGFDMQRIGDEFNWHDKYPAIKRSKKDNRYPTPYRRFLKCWRQVAIDAKRLGVEILNATPDSSLKLFPSVLLEDTL